LFELLEDFMSPLNGNYKKKIVRTLVGGVSDHASLLVSNGTTNT
jgi:hypothetical protein